MNFVKLKRNPYRYRRTLPHIQDSVPLFITFNTLNRWVLPPEARSIAMESCLFEHNRRVLLHAVVIMPEHGHLLFTIIESADPPPLHQILGDIKGASSHNINKLLGRKGHVWEEESMDRATRENEREYYRNYIIHNPVKRGLVEHPDDYPWLWYETEDQPDPKWNRPVNFAKE
ncbi:MAG TPA: transposase [Terriglobales bacterium]|nr:transposase [Terriglobales bacterium]